MFGADTPLVFDAIQMAGIAAAAGACAVWAFTRRRKRAVPDAGENGGTDLEDRVRVLERIATDTNAQDRTDRLADEIDALRDPAPVKTPEGETA